LIEKHLTLDRMMKGPDHKASLEPHELKAMIDAGRRIKRCLGDGVKRPTVSEISNKDVARKSLVAGIDIKKGEIFTNQNLLVKRPGSGKSPYYYWDLLGRKATRAYSPGEQIE
jgi:sialic acid synthase SpsE